MTRARAFTLIELLVVVVVLAILLGVIMPSLFGSREAGRVAKCQINLSQVGKAMRVYMNDQKKFPSLFGDAGEMGLTARSLACPMNRGREPAGWVPASSGPVAGWSWESLTSYECTLSTVPHISWNPLVYVNRWEQSRPDQQLPLCNDTRQPEGVMGWHVKKNAMGGETFYFAVWAAGDVTPWDGKVPQ